MCLCSVKRIYFCWRWVGGLWVAGWVVDRSVVGGFNKTANIGICFLYSPISREISSLSYKKSWKKKKKKKKQPCKIRAVDYLFSFRKLRFSLGSIVDVFLKNILDTLETIFCTDMQILLIHLQADKCNKS